MSGTVRICIETYGCQMNEYDTELVKSICAGDGFEIVTSEAESDVVLLNTCAVRERAHQKVYGRLQRLRGAHERRGLTIGVLGCMAQNLKDDLLAGHEHVDFVAGPDSYRRLPDLIRAARGGEDAARGLLADVKLSRAETYSGVDPVRGGGVNAWLAVMRGCDNMCTFCVVPYTRGRERSRDPLGVLAETRALVADGYKQVTLLGQNVNSYRHGAHRFADLIREVADVPGIERVRFTSPHPKDFPPDLIRAMAEHPNICNHIHLPLQAGSDRVLELMRRTYTNGGFRDLVARLRGEIPGLGLTTDIIVGFPTETPDEFEDTRRLVEDLRFDSAFIFKYSERKGTFAQKKLPDGVTPAEKTRRIVELIDLQKGITNQINRKLIGSTQTVLVEEEIAGAEGGVLGRTDHFKVARMPGGSASVADVVEVVVEDATGATLCARPVGGTACASQ